MKQYIAGKLQGKQHEAVRLHLEACEACSAALEKTGNTLALMNADQDSIPYQPFLYTRVKQQIANKKSTRGFPAVSLKLQPVMYSMVLIGTILAGINLGQHYVNKQAGTDYYIEALARSYSLNGYDLETIEKVMLDEEETDMDHENNY